MNNTARLTTAEAALGFMTAGKATVTIVSNATGKRFTYRIAKPKEEDSTDLLFVGVLSGPDNGADYSYLGTIRNRFVFDHGKKSKVSADAPSIVAFRWAWDKLAMGRMPNDLAVYHEGKCCRCGRLLTVPESIMSGWGPECRSKMGM